MLGAGLGEGALGTDRAWGTTADSTSWREADHTTKKALITSPTSQVAQTLI